MKNKVIIGIILVIVIGVVLYFVLKPSKVIISFDADGGSKVSDMEIIKGNKIKLPLVKKEGYDFIGWYIGDKKIDNNYVYNESVKLNAKWKYVITYTVSFDSRGGTELDNIILREGEKLKLPDNPSREDYIFLGWKNENGELVENNIIVDKDITLNAEWEYKFYCDAGYLLEDKKCKKTLSSNARATYKCPVGYLYMGKTLCFGEYKQIERKDLICHPENNSVYIDGILRCFKFKAIIDEFECSKNTGNVFYNGVCYGTESTGICPDGSNTTISGRGIFCGGKVVSATYEYVCPSGYSLNGKMCYRHIVETAKER